MTERPGEFRMSNNGIMKNYKLHRYPNAIRKPEVERQFVFHNVMAHADKVVDVQIYCSQLDFLLESKSTILSNKYARRFSWEQTRPVIASMITCLQETIRFAIFI
jgi:hypothetical protein